MASALSAAASGAQGTWHVRLGIMTLTSACSSVIGFHECEHLSVVAKEVEKTHTRCPSSTFTINLCEDLFTPAITGGLTRAQIFKSTLGISACVKDCCTSSLDHSAFTKDHNLSTGFKLDDTAGKKAICTPYF